MSLACIVETQLAPRRITMLKSYRKSKLISFLKKYLNRRYILILKILKLEMELKGKVVDTNDTLQKEVKLLKQMIKSIEEDSLKEKTNWQKQLHKKSREMHQLNEELDELRASERNLRHQVRVFISCFLVHIFFKFKL